MIEGARDAMFRFPVTAAALFLLAVYANFEIADAGWFGDFGWPLPLGLASAATAALAATLFLEARQSGAGLRHGTALVAALAAFGAVWFSGTILSHEFVLLPALAGLALVAPYLWRYSASAFWLFAVRFAFAVVLGGFALILAAGGISAILLSLTYLFGLDVSSELYGHVWATAGFLLAPLFGLGRLPKWFHDEPAGSEEEYMAIGIRALGDFVAAPLLLVYALILHAYAGKIILTMEVPKGQIGWLVLGYGFCLFGALLISYPYWRLARAPMRLLLHIWPFVMPVPLAMLFYAVWLRIGQYGVTPERYLLVLYGLVTLAIVVVQLSRPLRGDIRVMVALPVLALCFASFGPQGVNGWSIRSQAERFKSLVTQAADDVMKEGEAVSVLRFLTEYGGLGRVVPEGIELGKKQRSGRNAHDDLRKVAVAYGLNPDLDTSRQSGLVFNKYFNSDLIVPADGYDLIVPQIHFYNRLNSVSTSTLESNKKIVFALTDTAVTATLGDETAIFSLTDDMIRNIAEADGGKPFRLELTSGSRNIVMVLSQANGEQLPKLRLLNMSGLLMLRSRDWNQPTR